MMIERYSFGNILISGKTYTSDLIICPPKIIHPWWRQEGHFLQIIDLQDILAELFDLLIIGTGYYGRMKVANEVLKDLKKRAEIAIEITPSAIELFNKVSAYRKTIACLHLSC